MDFEKVKLSSKMAENSNCLMVYNFFLSTAHSHQQSSTSPDEAGPAEGYLKQNKTSLLSSSWKVKLKKGQGKKKKENI